MAGWVTGNIGKKLWGGGGMVDYIKQPTKLDQEPINRSLYLLYHALKSTLSRVDIRSPSTGAFISYTMPWSQPFPSRFIYRTALRGGFARTQFKDPIKTELDRVYYFTSHSPMI